VKFVPTFVFTNHHRNVIIKQLVELVDLQFSLFVYWKLLHESCKRGKWNACRKQLLMSSCLLTFYKCKLNIIISSIPCFDRNDVNHSKQRPTLRSIYVVEFYCCVNLIFSTNVKRQSKIGLNQLLLLTYKQFEVNLSRVMDRYC